MAGEGYTRGSISDVSRRDMLAQDPYFGLSNSFQYSENINCDDELHGIKLSQKIQSINNCSNCQLISAGDLAFAIPLSGGQIKKIKFTKNQNNETGTWTINDLSGTSVGASAMPKGAIFQDNLRVTLSGSNLGGLYYTPSDGTGGAQLLVPYDHAEDTDESIGSEDTTVGTMGPGAGCIINYNNTRLVVGVGNQLRVYYPELDATNTNSPYYKAGATPGKTGWKKVQDFEGGSVIVGLTCTFEYLKVWVQDEGWNTKIFYYQGNDDLRNTFVYDLIDLTGTKVLHAYNINGIDYYTASLDGTDGYVTFNKIIGKTPVQIFKQRGGLTQYDVNQKAGYFVGPTSIDAGYIDGNFYIADAFGVFKFQYDPQGYDKGYLKRKIRSLKQRTPGLCIYKNFVLVSDQNGLKMMRTYDTGIDGYESKGILISREMEGDYGGCVTKVMDEIRCHFELNPLIDDLDNAGSIDIYLSPNNTWEEVDPDRNETGWYHVLHIDGRLAYQNRKTRYEKITKLNCMNDLNDNDGTPAFEFDWETITYCIVIRKGWYEDEDEDTSTAKRTPIVREVNLRYNLKGKVNNVYEIK